MRGSAMPDPEGTGDEALRDGMPEVEAAARQSSRPASNATKVFPGPYVSYDTNEHFTDKPSMTLRNLPSRRANQQHTTGTYNNSNHHLLPMQQDHYNMTSTTLHRGRGTGSRPYRGNYWESNRSSSRGRGLMLLRGQGTSPYHGRGRGLQHPNNRRQQPPDIWQQPPDRGQQPSDMWQQPPDRWNHHSSDMQRSLHMRYRPPRREPMDIRQWAYDRKQQPPDLCRRSLDMHQQISDMHQQPSDMRQQPPDLHQQTNHPSDMRQQAPEMCRKTSSVQRQPPDICQNPLDMQLQPPDKQQRELCHTSQTTSIQLQHPVYQSNDQKHSEYNTNAPEQLKHCDNAPVVHCPILLKQEWPGHVSKYSYKEPHIRLRRLEEDPHRFVPTSNGRYHILHESPDRQSEVLTYSDSSFSKKSVPSIPEKRDNIFGPIKTEEEKYLCEESNDCVNMNTNFVDKSQESVLSIVSNAEENYLYEDSRETISGDTSSVEDIMESVLTIVKEEITIEEDPLEDELHRLMDSPTPSMDCSEELNEPVEGFSTNLVTKPPTPPISLSIAEPTEPQVELLNVAPIPLSPHAKEPNMQYAEFSPMLLVTKPPTPPLSPCPNNPGKVVLDPSRSLLLTKTSTVCIRRKSAPVLMALPSKAMKRRRRYQSWPSVSISDDYSECSQELSIEPEDFKSSYHQKLKLTRSSNETWKIVNSSNSCERSVPSFNCEIRNVCSTVENSHVHSTYSNAPSSEVNSDTNEEIYFEDQELKDTIDICVTSDTNEIEFVGEYRNTTGKSTGLYNKCESDIVLCDVISSPTFSAGIITAEEDRKHSSSKSGDLEMSRLVDRYTNLNHHVVEDFPDIPVVCDYGDTVYKNQHNNIETNRRPLYENCKIVLVSSTSTSEYETSKTSNIHSIISLDDQIIKPNDNVISTETSTVSVTKDDKNQSNEHILQVNDCLEITTRQTETDAQVENISNVGSVSPCDDVVSECKCDTTVPDSVIEEVPLSKTTALCIGDDARQIVSSEDSKDMYGFKYATTDTGSDDEDDDVLKIDEDILSCNDESNQSQQAVYEEKERHVDQQLKDRNGVLKHDISRKQQSIQINILQKSNEEKSKCEQNKVKDHHAIYVSNRDVVNDDKESESEKLSSERNMVQQIEDEKLEDKGSFLGEVPLIQQAVFKQTDVEDLKTENKTSVDALLPIQQSSHIIEVQECKEKQSKVTQSVLLENLSNKHSRKSSNKNKKTLIKRKLSSLTDKCKYQLRKRKVIHGKYEEIEPTLFIQEVHQSEEEQSKDVQINSPNQEPKSLACADNSCADKTISSASSTSNKCKQDSMPDHNIIEPKSDHNKSVKSEVTNKNGKPQGMFEPQHKVKEIILNTRLAPKDDENHSKTFPSEAEDNVPNINAKKSICKKKSDILSNNTKDNKQPSRKARSSRRSFRHDNIKMFKVPAPSSHVSLPWSYKSKALASGGTVITNQAYETEVWPDPSGLCDVKADQCEKDITTNDIQSCVVDGDVVECTDNNEDPEIILVQHISNKKKRQGSVSLSTGEELNCKVLANSFETTSDSPQSNNETSASTSRGTDNTNADETPRKKRGRKKRKKSEQEAPSVMEEVSQHIVTTNMHEKGRLAQEIPGFNWLEEKIRNGGVNTVLPSKQIQSNNLDSPFEETEPPEKQARLIESSDLENEKIKSSVPQEIVVEDSSTEKYNSNSSVVVCVSDKTAVEGCDIETSVVEQNNTEPPKTANDSPAKTPGSTRAPVIVSMSSLNESINPVLEQLASAGDLEVTISSQLASSSTSTTVPPSSFVSVQPVSNQRAPQPQPPEHLWQYFGGPQQSIPPPSAAKAAATTATTATTTATATAAAATAVAATAVAPSALPPPIIRPPPPPPFLTQSSQDQQRNFAQESTGEHPMLQRHLLSLPEQRWGWASQWPNVAAGQVAASELKAEQQQRRVPETYQQAFSERMATMARHAVTSFDTGLGLGLGHPPPPSQHHHLQQLEQYHQLQQHQLLQQHLSQQPQQQQQRRRHQQYRQPIAVAPSRLQQLPQGMLQYPHYMIPPYPTRPSLQRPAAQYPSIAYHHTPLYERVNGGHACTTNPAPPYYLDHRTKLCNISPPLPPTDQERELQTFAAIPRRVGVPRVNTRNTDDQRSRRHQPYPPHTVVHNGSDNAPVPPSENQTPDQSMEELELDKLHTKQMLNIVENKGLEARTALKELVEEVAAAATEEVIELRETIGSGSIARSTLPTSSPSLSCGQPTIGTTPMLHIGARKLTPPTSDASTRNVGMLPPSSRSPASSYRRLSSGYIEPGTSNSSTSCGRVNKSISQLSRPPEPIPAHSSSISNNFIHVSPNGISNIRNNLEESPIDLTISKRKQRCTLEVTNHLVQSSHNPSSQPQPKQIHTVPDMETRPRLLSTNAPNEPSRLWHQLMSAPNSSNVPSTSSVLVSLAGSHSGWPREQLSQEVPLPVPNVMQNIFENHHRRNSNEAIVHHRQAVHPHIVDPVQSNHHPPLMSRLNPNHGLMHRHSASYSDTVQSQHHREPHAPAAVGSVLQQQVSPMAGIIAPDGLNQANYPRERTLDNGGPIHNSRCNNCGEIARWQCSACHSAWYCSHPCQTRHWNYHSLACRKTSGAKIMNR